MVDSLTARMARSPAARIAVLAATLASCSRKGPEAVTAPTHQSHAPESQVDDLAVNEVYGSELTFWSSSTGIAVTQEADKKILTIVTVPGRDKSGVPVGHGVCSFAAGEEPNIETRIIDQEFNRRGFFREYQGFTFAMPDSTPFERLRSAIYMYRNEEPVVAGAKAPYSVVSALTDLLDYTRRCGAPDVKPK